MHCYPEAYSTPVCGRREGRGRKEGKGRERGRKEGGRRREERKEGERKIGEEEGGDREEVRRYAAVLNRDVHTTRVVNLNRYYYQVTDSI